MVVFVVAMAFPIGGLVGLLFWNRVAARFGGFSWIITPLLALGASFGLLVAIFVVGVSVVLVRRWRLRFEKPALALARKSAGEEGTVARAGPLTVWWSGPDDPVPTLTEQMATVRSASSTLWTTRSRRPRYGYSFSTNGVPSLRTIATRFPLRM